MDDEEPATQLYTGGSADVEQLGNEEGPTRFDASADLKAVIAHAQGDADPETPATMVLPGVAPAMPGPPAAPVAPTYQAAPAAAPQYPGWGPGGAPPGQVPAAAVAAPPPKSFATRLLISALVTFLLGGVALGCVALVMALS